MVQQTEHLPAPPGSGLEHTRSRFMIRDWTTGGREEITSEWYRGTSFPGVESLKGTTSVTGDGLGRVTSTKAADESLVTTEYAGDSITAVEHSVAASSGSLLVTDTTVKDALGRVRSVKEGVAGTGNPGVSSTYDYNVEDRLAEVKIGATNQSRSFAYSPGGFLLGSVEPERTTSYVGYDALGHPLSETTGEVTTTFTYDGFGRLTGTSASAAAAGSHDLTGMIYGGPTGTPAQLWTGAYGRVVTAEQKGDGNSGFAVAHTWQYNGPGRRVSARTTAVTSTTLQVDTNFTSSYGYDAWGNLSDLTSPGGTVTDSYDGSWILSSTSPGAGVVNLAGFSYLPNGRVSELCLGDPDPALTPDPDGCTVVQAEEADLSLMARPGSISAKVDDVVQWTTGEYGYDGSGNIMTIGLRNYEYDALSRLRRFDGPGFGSDSWIETFEYDDFGNITRWNGTSLEVDTGTNRLTAATYDSLGRGNMVTVPAFGSGAAATLTYSLEDRVLSTTSALGTRTYAYDTGGERVVERDATGALTLFARDESGRVLAELGSDGVPRKALLYAGGRLAAELENGELRYLVTDHLGSTRVLARMDAGEVVLDELEMFPFGAMMPGSDPPEVDLLFTGHERDLDSTGLDYMHARYYSSGLGRFLSVDPVGGAIGSSQSWNRYSYVRNNPVWLTDPDGRIPVPIVLALLFGLFGGAEYANNPVDRADPVVTDPQYENSNGMRALVSTAKGAAVGVGVSQILPATTTDDSGVLPDDAYQKDAPRQVEPGTESLEHQKLNPRTGELESSRVDFDEYGRQTQRTDYTDHGRANDPVNPHPNPHHHTTTYGQGTSAGHETGPHPGPAPGHSQDAPVLQPRTDEVHPQ